MRETNSICFNYLTNHDRQTKLNTRNLKQFFSQWTLQYDFHARFPVCL